jgi:hypothetical protein
MRIGGTTRVIMLLREDVRAKAELPAIRIHDLRHTFASLLVSGGMTLPMIGNLLGHAQVQTTQRYAHLLDDPLRAGIEQVGDSLRPKRLTEARSFAPNILLHHRVDDCGNDKHIECDLVAALPHKSEGMISRTIAADEVEAARAAGSQNGKESNDQMCDLQRHVSSSSNSVVAGLTPLIDN